MLSTSDTTLSSRFTPQERRIADLLLLGYSTEEIAKELKIAKRTVKMHLNRMYIRAGITDGIKRVKLAVRLYREREGKCD